jgi:hypothetical protein
MNGLGGRNDAPAREADNERMSNVQQSVHEPSIAEE